MIRLIITFLIFITAINMEAFPQSQKYFLWKNIPSKTLLEKCYKLCQNKETVDSAFIYGSVITNRYSPDMEKEEKRICAMAYINLWYMCFTHYNDFSKAYYYILKAEDIANEIEQISPILYMDLGCFYDFMGDQNNDISLKKEALLYYRKALKLSCNIENRSYINSIFFNIITLLMDYYEDTEKEWKMFLKSSPTDDRPSYKLNVNCYKAHLLAHKGKINEAMKLLNDSFIIEHNKNKSRTNFIIECLKANVYEVNKNYKNAISYMLKAQDLAEKDNINEIKLYSYKKLANYYKAANNIHEYKEYRNKYLSFKDSVFGYGQASKIGKIQFISKIDKMNIEISQMKQKREIQNVILIVVFIVLIIIIAAAVMLYIKNKQISKKNHTLYNKYKDMCLLEEKLNKRTNKNNDTQTATKDEKQKYVSSSLDEEKKNVLLEKIITIMKNTEEICSPSFSTDRLAELVGTNYKYISQVINEKYGYSFNILLNKYRIKEVCRRFSDTERYGIYTTEAISESVGFKNKSTFINAFKKEIGMTPYQYLKCLKQDRKNEQVTEA